MIKRCAKAVRRRIQKALQIPVPVKTWSNADNDDFSCAAINRTLDRLLTQEGPRLRPNYTWAVLQAAHMARTLGYERISALEFGVAGGNGLLALERAATLIEPIYGVKIDVHGFDTGQGLPAPIDYRDMPNIYHASGYAMDVPALQKRLSTARLHLGPIKDTLPAFFEEEPAPLGFVSIDVDYYSSTMDVLSAFEASHRYLMPRVHCYFDDIMGASCSEFTGERRAIADFNDHHAWRKIAPIYGLKYFLRPPHNQAQWSEMMYMAHCFDHPRQNDYDGLITRHDHDHTRLKPAAKATPAPAPPLVHH